MDEKDIEKKMQEAWNAHVAEQSKEHKESLWNEFSLEAFPPQKKRSIKWLYQAVAAVLVLSISVTAFVYLNTSTEKEQTMGYTIIENPSKYVKLVLLPDSSEVELQPEAVLRYNKNFKTNRNLVLTGDAFFRVQKDKKHPFTVACNDTKTTVLGTCFTVNGCEHKAVQVHLYEGRVQMNVNGNNSSWILAPGEKFEYKKGEVDVTAFNRFRDFDNAPLSEVISYIKKTYNYEIEIPENYRERKVTLRLNQKEELHNVVGILAQMYELKPIYNDRVKRIILQ